MLQCFVNIKIRSYNKQTYKYRLFFLFLTNKKGNFSNFSPYNTFVFISLSSLLFLYGAWLFCVFNDKYCSFFGRVWLYSIAELNYYFLLEALQVGNSAICSTTITHRLFKMQPKHFSLFGEKKRLQK